MNCGSSRRADCGRDGHPTNRCCKKTFPSTDSVRIGREALHVYDWLDNAGVTDTPTVYNLVEVIFKGGRKDVYRNTREIDLQTGDLVIVEADRGIDCGCVHMLGELVRLRIKAKGFDEETVLPNVLRSANLAEIKQWEQNKEKEEETYYIGQRAVDRMDLPMKLIDVEWQFDHKKVTFYFTADHRVDFRQLVRDLAGKFRTRVELRQIGARDEAARIGGLGSCGHELCCADWLQDFQPVSTQAAKIQNLPLNPVRLSGQCGRLKCCLNYELRQYTTALKQFPKVDTHITTQHGQGLIQKLDIFKEVVWIQYADGSWEDKPLVEVLEILNTEKVQVTQNDEAQTPLRKPKRRSKSQGRKPGRSGNNKKPSQ